MMFNTQEAVSRLNIAGEQTKGNKTGACHRLVIAALTGSTSSAVSFGFQQINAERALGIYRCDSIAASHHQLDDVIEEPLPGVPIIIEGPTHQHPDEQHCACVMASSDGRYMIVDTLLPDRFLIVPSSGEALSWARKTFNLFKTQFCEVDTSLFVV